MEREESVTFCYKDLLSTSFDFFEDMRKKEQLCDLTIHVGNASFAAHRLILAAAIPYFRSEFTSSESVYEKKEIALADMKPAILESLIRFAYTGQINISSENVQPLLVASEIFHVSHVNDACVEFLSEGLDLQNVSQVRALALKRKNFKLLKSTDSYIRQNFAEFCRSDDFLHLSYSCVREMISGDNLRISKEEIVFEAVMNWVKFLPSERKDFLPDLLSEVRMVHLDIRYLIKRVASEELIRLSAPSMCLIQNAQSYHLLTKEESSVLNLKTQPRTHPPNGIYALCYCSSLGYSVYLCDLVGKTWNIVKSEKLELGAAGFRSVVVNDSIYLFSKKGIARFIVKLLQWEIVDTLFVNSGAEAMVSHQNKIYVFGGLIRSEYHKIVRCFNTMLNEWLEEEKMTSRSCSSAASFQESIYVTGGLDMSLNYMDSVEKYNPATREWSVRAPMLNARSSHGCASLNRKIYVGGGINRKEWLKTAEVFDPQINQWKFISLMGIESGRCMLLPHTGKMFAFRYLNRHNEIHSDNFEFYDTETEQWVKSHFSTPVGFLSAVFVPETYD